MNYSRETKLEILKGLNWDYNVSPEDMLAVVEGEKEEAGPFDRTRIFVRSLERLPWHRIVGLWGWDRAEKMLVPETIKRVWMKGRRDHIERLAAILRGETLPPAEWSDEMRGKLRNTVFSHRWYRTQSRVL